ncbi:arylsulfatase [Synechococcus sp. PCC 7336]|uniref:arylsulfatase B n=1 Tax=Synechococcus sp. PCC 7336 TaxID=195250 RepID=UPI000364C3BF|nr:arylsulfatase [Synechococcus sp. PCC 7336]
MDRDRPNIVIIVADDLGWNDVGYHGSEIQTPNIDHLAGTSVQLDRFYAKNSCTPYRAALMTGVHPFRYGMSSNVIQPWDRVGLPIDRPTIAEVLKEYGYRTAIVGKWHLGHWNEAFLPTSRGFDYHYGNYCSDLDYFSHTNPKGGSLDWHRNRTPIEEEGYSTDLLAAEASSLIETHDYNKTPLFLYVSFNAPHTPLQAKEGYIENYRSISNVNRRTYGAMVQSLDEGVGTIVSALKKSTVWDNTLVVFTSDNGGGYNRGAAGDNRPLNNDKGSVYDGGVRVPTLFRFPNKTFSNEIDSHFYSVVDLFPTFLEAAGVDSGDFKLMEFDGQSILSSITNEAVFDRDEMIVQIDSREEASALIRPPYKYIWHPKNSWFETEELYNLVIDPGEVNNLIDSEVELAQLMRDHLASHRQDIAPSILVPLSKIPSTWGIPNGFMAPKVINPTKLQRLNTWPSWGNPFLWTEKVRWLSWKKLLVLGISIGIFLGISFSFAFRLIANLRD